MFLSRRSGDSWVRVSDVGKAEDSSATQYNIVRVDGQKSSYIPILKQGGDTNTIQVVNGVRGRASGICYDIPKQMKADLLFDQSVFVKEAINTVLHESSDRSGPDQSPDPSVSGKFPGHHGRSAFDSHLRSGDVRHFEPRQRHHQHHDPRRTGAGFFARHRQFRDFHREHLSATWKWAQLPAVAAEVGASEVTLAVLAAHAGCRGRFLSRSRCSSASVSFCFRRWRCHFVFRWCFLSSSR